MEVSDPDGLVDTRNVEQALRSIYWRPPPSPIKSDKVGGSYGIKVRVRMPCKSVKVPLFCGRARDFYAIQPLILWQNIGAYFC